MGGKEYDDDNVDFDEMQSMNTHKEEPEIVIETKDGHSWMCECSKCLPTPPSQIEEESQTQRSLREMYELGKEHGRSLALKDMEIEKLVKEIKGE